MPRHVPLKPTKKQEETKKKEKKREIASRPSVSPYDIVLGKVEMSYEKIPEYIEILKKYQRECQNDARYMEAEMAKQRIEDMKNYMQQFKLEILKNYHLKERCEIEDAYVKEFNSFNKFWEQKALEFEENVLTIQTEFEERQKSRYDDFIDRISKDSRIKRNCITNEVLNLQKIEVALAKQKNYIEAQNKRLEWQQMIKDNFATKMTQAEQSRMGIIEEFERKQKKEAIDFQKKIEELREEQERVRERELKNLTRKYDKLKVELKKSHKNETKAVLNDVPIVLNDGKILPSGKGKKLSKGATEKKKMLIKRINKLDETRKY